MNIINGNFFDGNIVVVSPTRGPLEEAWTRTEGGSKKRVGFLIILMIMFGAAILMTCAARAYILACFRPF